MPQSIPLTPATALAHERLYPRVTALLKQVERAASRHPQQPVPDATRAVARTLFGGARKILGREALRSLGSAGGDLSALSVGLGQLVALLEGFEAMHSGWSGKAKCTVWRVEGPVLPVTRLRPPGVEAGPEVERNPEQERIRAQLEKLIAARYAAGYDVGYRDASEGRPPSSEYGEMIWDKLVEEAGGDEGARLRELKRLYGTTRPPPHLMPVGAKPGEWKRIQAERQAAEQAERRARYGPPRDIA